MKISIETALYLVPGIVVVSPWGSHSLTDLVAISAIFLIGPSATLDRELLQDRQFSRDALSSSIVLGYIWLATSVAFTRLQWPAVPVVELLNWATIVAAGTSAIPRVRRWQRLRNATAPR